MKELFGKYNTATVFTDNIEQEAISQIEELLNQPFAADSFIRIMPDVHAGKGCVIGTTMTIKDKVVPNLVGVDIGCGMLCVKLETPIADFVRLDEIIHKRIPTGFNVRNVPHSYIKDIRLNELHCIENVNISRAELSLGTLGGGNHFIELNQDEDGEQYFVIHSGSRNLGVQVAKYYQDKAIKTCSHSIDYDSIIKSMKADGREKDIAKTISQLKQTEIKINPSLAYLEGELFDDYMHDIKIVQEYACYNRMAIAEQIFSELGYEHLDFLLLDKFETVHNYIDITNMILRKGAISAHKEQKVIIPMNMRDGSLICMGKGNPDWNFSAPHGAGRIMSRSQAKRQIELKDFETSMEGIYSSTINASTIDESPFAYKPMDEIIANIADTVEIVHHIKPIYNLKAAE